MTLSHIEQLEWGVCLIPWCGICGTFFGRMWRDELPMLYPAAEGAITAVLFFILPIVLGIYAGVYAAWRT